MYVDCFMIMYSKYTRIELLEKEVAALFNSK